VKLAVRHVLFFLLRRRVWTSVREMRGYKPFNSFYSSFLINIVLALVLPKMGPNYDMFLCFSEIPMLRLDVCEKPPFVLLTLLLSLLLLQKRQRRERSAWASSFQKSSK